MAKGSFNFRPHPCTVLVTGAAGMLGRQVLLDAPSDIVAIGTDLREGSGVTEPNIDLVNASAVAELFARHQPWSVMHTAAWTDVDGAEEHETEAQRANVDICRVLAELCNGWDIPLLLVSTDYVYNGMISRPYIETDPTDPMSVYGRTKLDGEKAAQELHPGGTIIARTEALYGLGPKHFPRAIFNAARKMSQIRVVNDLHVCPTSTLELAPALWDLLLAEAPGIYHASCEGACTWYEMAVAVLQECGINGVNIVPVSTAEYFANATRRIAHRPANSVFNCSKLAEVRHGKRLAHWRDALRAFLVKCPL